MRYSNSVLETRDIDWFAKVDDIYIHVASAGGLIPDAVNDSYFNRKTLKYVLASPNINEEVEVNNNHINEVLQSQEILQNHCCTKETYTHSFNMMARKGFYSFDRFKNTNKYVLVSSPKCKFQENRENNMIYIRCIDNNIIKFEKDNNGNITGFYLTM